MPSNTPLPIFNRPLDPRLDRVFAPMCTALSPAQASDLRRTVSDPVRKLRAALARNAFLDVASAEQIANVLTELLDGCARQSEAHRSLIIGAARYFVEARDAAPDLTSLLGFDDDAQVLHYVLEAIGRADLRIEL